MRNFIQPGKVVTAIAPAGGVVSGQFVKLGDLFGIAATTALVGEEFELSIGEVYELPKVAAEAWTFGQSVYATAAGIMTTTSGGNTKVGVAVGRYGAAANSGSALVRLNDVF